MENGYGYIPPVPAKPQNRWLDIISKIVIPLIAALISLVGSYIVGKMSMGSEIVQSENRLMSTMNALYTQAAGCANGSHQPCPVCNTTPTPSETPSPTPSATPSVTSWRLHGTLTDRSGSVLPNILIGVVNGPEITTDKDGIFVLNNVKAGDQILTIKSPSGRGQLTQNIHISPIADNFVNVIYDSSTESFGLLTIVSPVNGSILKIKPNEPYTATISGKVNGLSKIFKGADNFDIWILVDPGTAGVMWVQSQPAVIDQTNSTWQAKAVLGDSQSPPQDGQKWLVIAVAATTNSGMGTILNTPSLSLLPPHISSNVMTIETQW